VSDKARYLETEEQRERFHEARRSGGLCAACGRPLGPDEPVYIEVFTGYGRTVKGPVGTECASDKFLDDTHGCDPERCVGCGRSMYYRVAHARRQQAVCSVRCRGRSVASRRRLAEQTREKA
jgi:hypothetical protein